MSTSLHVTTVTRFGASTEVIVFDKWTDAINARTELEDTYSTHTEIVLIATLLEGTA